MKKWTQKNLQEEGYKVLNMMVENVDIVMRDSVAMLQMVVKSTDHHYIYGGYLGAEGLESILKIMDVIGAKAFSDIKGRYIRVAVKGCSNSPKIVGNILQDRWFDIESFLQDKDDEKKEKKEEKDDYTWIPCSVRFPTYRDEYTVTIENFHGERSIDTRFYWGDKNFKTAADAQYHVKVVAWVPNRNLEPWKGDAKFPFRNH